jgi:PAS domain S-box-containing protein
MHVAHRRASAPVAGTLEPPRREEHVTPSPSSLGAAAIDRMPHAQRTDLDHVLRELRSPLLSALESMPVPIWIVDRGGSVRWMNRAAALLLGRRVGSSFSTLVAPGAVHETRERLARKLRGESDGGLHRTTLKLDGGIVDVDIASTPLRWGTEIVGVISVAGGELTRPRRRPSRPRPRLTPRQHEVLALLGEGRSTAQIAGALGVTEDTARNHIRHLLVELGVHSRLEAVVVAFRNGWLRP